MAGGGGGGGARRPDSQPPRSPACSDPVPCFLSTLPCTCIHFLAWQARRCNPNLQDSGEGQLRVSAAAGAAATHRGERKSGLPVRFSPFHRTLTVTLQASAMPSNKAATASGPGACSAQLACSLSVACMPQQHTGAQCPAQACTAAAPHRAAPRRCPTSSLPAWRGLLRSNGRRRHYLDAHYARGRWHQQQQQQQHASSCRKWSPEQRVDRGGLGGLRALGLLPLAAR